MGGKKTKRIKGCVEDCNKRVGKRTGLTREEKNQRFAGEKIGKKTRGQATSGKKEKKRGQRTKKGKENG